MVPETIRVKLLSEVAEYLTVSHVMQREMSPAELVELILPVVGRDKNRIRQILHVGTISTGDYRYRWDRWDAQEEEVEAILQGLPGPDPSRAFQPDACFLIRFCHGLETLDLPQERAAQKTLFARQSFWDGLLQLAARGVHYADYSQADKADVFALPLDTESAEMLRGFLPLLKPKSAAERLGRLKPERIEWLVRR
ncbi:MAG: hypothetical protein HY647_08615 [Acidobacteria bacterium]|nr:hypothetical protein [Acidobacteriota bacterium]